MFNILIVCDGNTCRSPMAHVFMADLVMATGCDEKLSVDTAGLKAVNGQKPADNAVKVMEKRGFDITHFRAKLLDDSLIRNSDLVLAMSNSQKKEIKSKYGRFENLRVMTFVEAARIAKNFKSVASQNKFSDMNSRLRSIAELGDMDSILEFTDGGKAFLNSAGTNSSEGIDIFDPFDGDLETYERCAKIIQQYAEQIVSFICEGENIC